MSTGIAIETIIVQTIIDMVCYIVISALRDGGIRVFYFVLAILGFLYIIARQLLLAFKPDLKMEAFALPAIKSSGFYPTAVRFGQAGVGEERSRKADARFDWRLRLLVGLHPFRLIT